MKWAVLAALAVLLAAAAVLKLTGAPLTTPTGTAPVHPLKIGEASVITLQGNPSTGYSWKLNVAASDHLDIVSVEDLGYASPPPPKPGEPPLVGVPQEQSFRITAKAAGTAKLAFEYMRPWEGEAVQKQTFHIEVR